MTVYFKNQGLETFAQIFGSNIVVVLGSLFLYFWPGAILGQQFPSHTGKLSGDLVQVI